jgi:hypothetical protein
MTIATLLGALGGYALASFARKKHLSFLPTLPTVVANAVIVPLLLIFVYGVEDAYLFLLFTVSAGELLSATVLGTLLLKALSPYASRLFKK